MYSYEFFPHLVSVILAAMAAVSAIYLIPLAGKAKAWWLFFAALVLLVTDRVLQLFSYSSILLDPATYKVVSDMLDVAMAGCLLGSVYYIRDIFLERKQAEEKIRQLNEELEAKVKERTQQLLQAQNELIRKEKLAVLGQVAGSVGHELRNPLSVMNNAVYFLQTVLEDADETTKEYLNIIKDEIATSERIVPALLDAVRTKPPQPAAVSVAELIAQTLRKCNVPPTVTVQQDIPATLSPLHVDAPQIQQALRNLISNGIEAIEGVGTLEIRAVEDMPAKTITVSIRDNGSGMTPEQLGHLFQPLFTTKARGIGLGLVVVKNLTQANGGKVDVQSEVGKGSVFSITLPT
jgi:signal transduction histidine kinase